MRVGLDQGALDIERSGERREVRVLPDRRDDGVGVELEFASGDRRHRELPARGTRRERHAHAFEPEAPAVNLDDLVQHRPVDEHDAFLQRLGDFLALRRHLRRALQGEDRDVVSGAPRAARDVERSAAAADHDDRRGLSAGGVPAFARAR